MKAYIISMYAPSFDIAQKSVDVDSSKRPRDNLAEAVALVVYMDFEPVNSQAMHEIYINFQIMRSNTPDADMAGSRR